MPFVRGHRSVFPGTPRNTGVYTRHPTFVTATSGVLTRLPVKLSKNGMRVYTLSDRRSKTKLRVYTASEAKGLITYSLLRNKINVKPVHLYQSAHDYIQYFEFNRQTELMYTNIEFSHTEHCCSALCFVGSM